MYFGHNNLQMGRVCHADWTLQVSLTYVLQG